VARYSAPGDFAASGSRHPLPSSAVGEVVGDVLEQMGDEPDLALVFTTAHLDGALEDIVGVINATIRPRVLLGASAASVIANGEEIEGAQGISLWAGRVGNVTPFLLDVEVNKDSSDEIAVRASTDLTAAGAHASAMLLMSDPFTFPAEPWLQTMDHHWPGLPVFGGMASSGAKAGTNRLICNDRIVNSGAVGAFFHGACSVRTILSQGCRPIGTPFIVTKCERNVIYELGGRPALSRLDEIVASLDESQRTSLRGGVQIGLVINEHQVDFQRGDFLVRGVLGADRSNGAIAIQHQIELGATVQFHVRDGLSASIDLEQRMPTTVEPTNINGSLLFNCTGRGESLFGRPSHDAATVFDLTNAPVAGMSCAGEFGSVGARSFVHTFTASIATFSNK
jgi:small ligand-binding sensory domain FIST